MGRNQKGFKSPVYRMNIEEATDEEEGGSHCDCEQGKALPETIRHDDPEKG